MTIVSRSQQNLAIGKDKIEKDANSAGKVKEDALRAMPMNA